MSGTPGTPAASNAMAMADRRACNAIPAGDHPSGANLVPYMAATALRKLMAFSRTVPAFMHAGEEGSSAQVALRNASYAPMDPCRPDRKSDTAPGSDSPGPNPALASRESASK